MIRLTLHLWSKLHPDQSDGLGFEIQDVWESTKEELPHSTDHITVDWCRADWILLILWCIMTTLKEQCLKLWFYLCHSSHDQVNTILLIKGSPWSIRWIRVWDSRSLGEHQRRASSFNGSHQERTMQSRPNIADIVMHDVNIKGTKLETSIFALSLFSWSS